MSVRFAGTALTERHPDALSCAFVNNMPDTAFDATERQFCDLLAEGSGEAVIEVRRYALDEVPRGDATAARISKEYAPARNLYLDVPDILIVTGSNPIEVEIRDEPYWGSLVELLSWSRDHVRSTLLSCLSAHAFLAEFEGVERVRLASKCTGVFGQSVVKDHWLTSGIATQIVLPHSRWSAVPSVELEGAGFDVVVDAPETGWAVATRERGDRSLLLVQGHPEYDPWSLLREYRRDAGRYVRGEREELPCLPVKCTAEDDWPRMTQLHRDIANTRDPQLVKSFPFDDVGNRAPWSWRDDAKRLYANWLSSVVHEGD